MPNIQLKDSGDATPLESGGSAERLDAELSGKNYEQITSALKAQQAGAEPEAEPSPDSPAPATPAAGSEDDLRLMTDEEVAQLPPDLQREAKALRKRLLGAYTRKTQDLAEIRRRAEFADRFESDPDFRAQVVRQYAQPAQPPPAQPPGPAQVPPQYVQLRRQTLPAELQWMAEALALGDYQRDMALYQGYIQPLQQQYQTGEQTRAAEAYRRVEGEFADRNPGWDAHEDEMVDLVEFLKGNDLVHPRWGNKLEILYRIATGQQTEAKAVQQAIQRTAQAVQNKSVTGGGGRGAQPNVEERVRVAKTDREAWDMAKSAAKGARG